MCWWTSCATGATCARPAEAPAGVLERVRRSPPNPLRIDFSFLFGVKQGPPSAIFVLFCPKYHSQWSNVGIPWRKRPRSVRILPLAFLCRIGEDDMVVVTSVPLTLRGGRPVDLAAVLYGRLDRSWQAKANCMGVDPDLFFPERGASTREAKEVCRGCVVREDCLEYALANGEKFGIWGGMSERERRRLRRARALQRRAAMTDAS
jgi:WhiB family transcriptional regulator, redox-sensing transcriptional regulator